MDCIFCKIANKEIKSEIVHEDEQVVVFKDINPQAPVHLLIVPKKHISTFNDLSSEDCPLIDQMVDVAQKMARQFNVVDSGYRTVINCNKEGGQVVFHLHMHLLGGQQLGDSMVG